MVRLSAIGDCLHAVPVLDAIRRQLPDAFIGWAIEAAGHELLRGHPYVDRFHLFPRGRGQAEQGRRWRALRSFRRGLRQVGYTVSLDLQGLTKSGLVAWSSGASRRIGFAGAESRELNRILCNERIRVSPSARHVVERNLGLLEPLGLRLPEEVEWTLPDYGPEDRLNEQFLRRAGLARRDGPGFAIVNPGTTWSTKRWPPEAFAAVARGLVERCGLRVVVTWGTADERHAAEALVAAAGGGPGALVAPATDLRRLAALVGRASLFVGGDTGPLHLAAALTVPCVAIFGATDQQRNGPYGRRHEAVSVDLECRPCWSKRCARGDLACLARLSPEAVLAACERVSSEHEMTGAS